MFSKYNDFNNRMTMADWSLLIYLCSHKVVPRCSFIKHVIYFGCKHRWISWFPQFCFCGIRCINKYKSNKSAAVEENLTL